MFERFTKAARAVLLNAIRNAEQHGAREITAEHLALAVLAGDGTTAAGILDEYGLPRAEATDAIRATRRRGGLSDADTAALRELGIDVDAVVARVEQTLGEGAMSAGKPTRRRGLLGRSHRPLTDEAKRVIEGSLHEALDRGDRHIGEGELTRRGGQVHLGEHSWLNRPARVVRRESHRS
ncbi:MAG: peptidase [Actinobacteria bacterium]|nr:peptidase [Actinomycetota bacterium]